MRRIHPQIIMLFHVICGLSITSIAQADGLNLTVAAQSTKSSSSVTLKWSTLDSKAKYTVYRDLLPQIASMTGTTYVDTRVAGGQTHTYYVIGQSTTSRICVPVLSNKATIKIPVASVAAPPPAPQGLAASGVWVSSAAGSGQGSTEVKISWTAVTGATSYKVYRGGSLLQAGLTQTAFTDTTVTSGQSYSYTVTAVGPGGEGAKSGAASATAPNPPVPSVPLAPQGLTATPQWVTSCPVCNGMAMAHIVLSWSAVTGATSYKVYRGGSLLQAGLTATGDTDMTVTSGQTYSYTVTAVGPGGEGAKSGAASATAPNTPASAPANPPVAMGTALIAPVNLAAHGFWQGAPGDTLTWDPAPGAVTYNVYQYDTLIGSGVTGTTFTVPFSVYHDGVTYSVSAVDGMGMESLPSNLALAYGGYDPTNPPGWVTTAVPVAPDTLIARPEWNNGVPRIALSWQHGGGRYNVYRDGTLVASDIWTLTYFDQNIAAGATHTYAVASVNVATVPATVGPICTSVTATAPSSAPAALTQKVQIVGVQAQDDSAIVSFTPVPGALDYRIYNVNTPNSVKYAGRWVGATQDMISHGTAALPTPTTVSIQWNGIDPTTGADLVVEAVDKLGPFQKMDGAMGPGAMQMDGSTRSSLNGQGDSSNVPNVLARSDQFHVACQPETLTGAQAFFDTFRNEAPLSPSTLLPELAALNVGNNGWVQEQENDKWRIRTYGADNTMTRSFFMGNHFMDTLYDGPYALHNNNASLVLMPKATADISGGKVLHVTFEVDAHFDGRRWCDLFVGEAGDTLIQSAPTKLGDSELPTLKGNLLAWQIQSGHNLELIRPTGNTTGPVNTQTDLTQTLNVNDAFTLERDYWRQVWSGFPVPNGSPQNLDKRSKFDLYLSQTHYRIVETEPDGVSRIVRDKDFPAGVSLPFTNCQVYFVHEVYHTGNDRPELVASYSEESYWYNDRPWGDERHWDNMGFEVLPSFPQ